LADADIGEMLPAKLLDKLGIDPAKLLGDLDTARAACQGMEDLL
jgi:hypothetical protein